MSGGSLDWNSEHRDGARIVAPAGRVDEATATFFAESLAASVADGGRIVIDLAEIAYMSSRGLRGLTLAQRKASEAGARIVLARPNETMREILAISRYDMIFRVFETVEEALVDEA
ncbi:Putative anti-sigma factor antagonist [Tsuneonella dongtanensis]|uniref:Anti-sigma factor antagonist n=1 Tax=Tsuneonella dongtanensis TaxID=692370 RepID=A0A1B2AGW5_9SPHN|nr:STAS domain-containing protein [Tsuneonella dongtanensis]ANY21393.1 Putative anti-sigma factor antagonist [Tsuneonella dongtanensis]